MMMTDFEEGFLLGILVGEGHFECGPKLPAAQVVVKMHVRQAELFHWLCLKVPGSALYGPYHHDGRHYLQWMVRGRALRGELLPFLKRHIGDVDSHVRARIAGMIQRYKLQKTFSLV